MGIQATNPGKFIDTPCAGLGSLGEVGKHAAE
jgi:hypothetical protein